VDYIKRENQQMLINNKAFEAYKKLYEASLLENLELMIFSAYRSYEYQENLYKKEDNNYVAAPGASEHQTGMALDIATPSTGLTNHFDNLPFFSKPVNTFHEKSL
jgi:D-alanyl-D-alanine carboxypeptidase